MYMYMYMYTTYYVHVQMVDLNTVRRFAKYTT